MNPLMQWILTNSMIVAFAIPVVWMFSRWRWARPAEAHLLWLCLLLKLMLPPIAAWPVSLAFLRTPAAIPVTAPTKPRFVFRTMTADPVAPPALVAEPLASPRLLPADASSFAPAIRPTPQIRPARVVDAMPGIWLGGTLLVLGITLIRLRKLRRLLANSHAAPESLHTLLGQIAAECGARPVALRQSLELESPCICSLGRAVLLWPQGLDRRVSSEGVESMLAHELAHVTRRDHLVVWLELVGLLACWWNPLFWIVRWQLRETRELACDARALERGRGHRRELAEILVTLTQGKRPATSAVSMVGTGFAARKALRRRLTMLFDDRVSGRMSLTGFLLAALLATATLPGFSWSDDENSDSRVDDEGTIDVQIDQTATLTIDSPEILTLIGQVVDDLGQNSVNDVELHLKTLAPSIVQDIQTTQKSDSPREQAESSTPSVDAEADVRVIHLDDSTKLVIRRLDGNSIKIEAFGKKRGEEYRREVILNFGENPKVVSVRTTDPATPVDQFNDVSIDAVVELRNADLARLEAVRAVKRSADEIAQAKLTQKRALTEMVQANSASRAESMKQARSFLAHQSSSADVEPIQGGNVEFADINVEEKQLLVEEARDILAKDPDNPSLSRKVRLAELALRRAVLERKIAASISAAR